MWVIELQFTADEVCHVNKVRSVGKTSDAPFGQLNLSIETFKMPLLTPGWVKLVDDPGSMSL